MSVMTASKLNATIRNIGKVGEKYAELVHEALISASFYAYKDGNTNPLNDILDAVEGTARERGIHLWCELFAPVRLKEDRFVLSKKARKDANIVCEEQFADAERQMRESPRWDEMLRKAAPAKEKPSFDPYTYALKAAERIDKNGSGELAKLIADTVMAYKAKHASELTGPRLVEMDKAA